MPFSEKEQYQKKFLFQYYKNIKKSCSLQVLRRKEYFKNILILKRVFSFASEKGSLTLEATISVSMFMFAVVAIMGILEVTDLQQGINVAMDNMARELAQTIYYIEQVSDVSENIEKIENKEEQVESLFATGSFSEEEKQKAREDFTETAFIAYVYGKFVSELKMKNINKSSIYGGMAGLDFTKSTYNKEDGEMSIILKYRIKVPFISDKIWKINDCKRVYVKVWNGKDISKENSLVYITKTGKVYHTTKKCQYLDLNIAKSTYKQVENLRNKSGAKYEMCKLCKLKKYSESTLVYITDYGTAFHFSLSCGGITRSVIQIDKKAVGDRSLCKKCKERE